MLFEVLIAAYSLLLLRHDKHGNRIARQLAVVLPLRLEVIVGVLPMPFIVDTGASSTAYLGSKILKELDSINNLLISDFEYLVKGSLGDEILSPVYAHQ